MFGPPSDGTQDLSCSHLGRSNPERAGGLHHGGVNKAWLCFCYRYGKLAQSGKISEAIEINRLESLRSRISSGAAEKNAA
jgi:hypothetical protein